MNAPVFWRLVWKEYRRLRGFWIGVAVLAVLLDLLALAFGPPDAHLGNVQGQLLGFMFAVALGASALYAVGAAAVIFAAEREEKTFAFLNILPSNPWPVMGGKMAAAGASALALAVILSLAGFAFAGWRVPDGILAGRLLAWLGVAILEMLAWGIFCSLLLKQPLVASLLAIFLASCGASLAVTLTVPNAAGRANVQAYADAMFYRLIFVALVATLDGYLARHWLTGNSLRSLWRRGAGVAPATRPLAASGSLAVPAALAPPRRAPPFPILARLVWQTWRQSWQIIVVFLTAGFVVMPLTVLFFRYTRWLPSAIMATTLGSLIACFMGVMTFNFDQVGLRYAFFSERAERPRLVWFGRLLVWGGAAVLLVIGLQAITATSIVKEGLFQPFIDVSRQVQVRDAVVGDPHWWRWRVLQAIGETTQMLSEIRFSIAAMTVAFAVGQFFSMAVRSGIMGGFFAAIVSVLGMMWIAIVNSLEISLSWTVTPPVVGLLTATWWRAPSWILGRRRIRSWMVPVTIVLTSCFLVAIGTARYRVAEVPDHGLGDASGVVAAYHSIDTPDARATADMYLRAATVLRGLKGYLADVPKERREKAGGWESKERRGLLEKWVSDNRDVLEIVLEAAARPNCALPQHAHTSEPLIIGLEGIRSLVEQDGALRKQQGDLDTALARYLASMRMARHFGQHQSLAGWFSLSQSETHRLIVKWSAAPGQTPGRIRDALAALDDPQAQLIEPADALVGRYYDIRRIVAGEELPTLLVASERDGDRRIGLGFWITYTIGRLPWERERAYRVLDAMLVYELRQLVWFEKVLRKPIGESHQAGAHVRWIVQTDWLRDIRRSGTNMLQRPLSWLGTTPSVSGEYEWNADLADLTRMVANYEVQLRALRLQLALIGWRLEHGAYPETLDMLVGEYLEKLPRDPFADGPFRYLPRGYQGEGEFLLGGEVFSIDEIVRKTPVIWSVGPLNQVDLPLTAVQDQEDGATRYRYGGGGWVFPLPEFSTK